MRIALGSDHAGVGLKARIAAHLDHASPRPGLEITDFGPADDASVDYPDFARPVAEAVASGEADRGILICGSGVGMTITANKVRGVRAAPASTTDGARLAREHNDANVLTLGARVLTEDAALAIVETFLTTDFEGGRHQRRLDKIAALEHVHDADAR